MESVCLINENQRGGIPDGSQFHETYAPLPKLAALLRELSWSKHLMLMSSCKSEEEMEFYLLSATRARWSNRELER